MNESIQGSITIIETQLQKLSDECAKNFGLHNGKTGLCICYFLLAKITGNKAYETNARILLDELSDNIGRVEELDFENGLAGIGWGIEWLVQNNFVDANTDEVLEDLDDELYKSVVYAKAASLSLQNGTLGKAMFFYKRLMAQNHGTERYRSLCNQECLVLLTDEINETLLNAGTGLLSVAALQQNLTLIQLTEIAQSLIFLIKLVPLGVNAEITEKLICNIFSFIQGYKEGCTAPDTKECNDAYQYLLFAYLLAGTKLNDNGVIKNATGLLEKHSLTDKSINDAIFFKNYLNNRVMDLLQQQSIQQPNRKPETIFDIMALCCLHTNGQLGSWNEAWLLS